MPTDEQTKSVAKLEQAEALVRIIAQMKKSRGNKLNYEYMLAQVELYLDMIMKTERMFLDDAMTIDKTALAGCMHVDESVVIDNGYEESAAEYREDEPV
jgi:hypothetical protein